MHDAPYWQNLLFKGRDPRSIVSRRRLLVKTQAFRERE